LAAEKRTAPKAATVRAVAKGDDLEPVMKADPLFGSGWQAWAAQAQRQGGTAAALAVLEKAPVAQMTPYDAARIRVVLAELRKDKKAHAAAMLALAALSPADLDLQEKAAQEALVVRNYAGAMGLFERLAGLTRHPRFSNQLAYAAVYAGDRAKAESAAAAMAVAPNESSFADTRGDVAYAFGDYAAAAQAFEAAANLNATFAGGLDLWKAADAARRAGDKARAEALLQRYLDVRAKGGMRNPLLVQAVWDWHGDAPEAAAEKLRAASRSTERGKALFLLGLMALNRRDLAGAERVRRELDANTMESVFLGSLVAGTPMPPGLPFPPEAIRALQLFLKDDKAGAAKELASAWEGLHPSVESQWRKLEALLAGTKPKWQLPPSPDDWLAVLLR
jgi:tetratricopeptide (TPR) repeat protein